MALREARSETEVPKKVWAGSAGVMLPSFPLMKVRALPVRLLMLRKVLQNTPLGTMVPVQLTSAALLAVTFPAKFAFPQIELISVVEVVLRAKESKVP